MTGARLTPEEREKRRKEYNARYDANPVHQKKKVRMKAYLDRPEVKKRRRDYAIQYAARPEVRTRLIGRAASPEAKKYHSDYYQRHKNDPEFIRKQKERFADPVKRKQRKGQLKRYYADPGSYYNTQEARNKRHELNRQHKKTPEGKKQARAYLERLKERFLAIYGYECECCHEKTIKLLTMAHKTISRKQEPVTGQTSMMRLAIRSPDKEKYGVQCYNCNCGSAANDGICPHRRVFSSTGDRARLRQQFFAIYGSECECCHEKNPKFLTLGHKSIRRNQEQPSTTRVVFLRAIRNPDKERYGVQCFNCNIGAERNGGICPHKDAR